MARIHIGMGSNVDRERNIRSGLAALAVRFAPLALSPLYEATAVGFSGDDFLNLVVGADTALSPIEVMRALREIEYAHGRVRGEARFAPRTLDLDLLLYDDLVASGEDYTVPRRDIVEYAFVLKPLADLWPSGRHPALGLTYAEMWAAFPHPETAGIRPAALELAGLAPG
jgi:2-amino-4-hydroxy-6-hydroxymethyldihydropteridine diphosphokinase